MELTKLYLMKKFEEYYSNVELYIPESFEMREWAFVPLKNFPDFVMVRHLSFSNSEELKEFILSNIPAHVYFSSAYYLKPSADMDEKEWRGADLIFDIDYDHLPTRSLKSAKREVFKLVKILENDFSVDSRNIEVCFSGNRGYHVHVYDERFRDLGTMERREIVDYFTLRGFKLRGTQFERVCKVIYRYILNAFKDGRIEKIVDERTREILRINLREIRNGNIDIIPQPLRDELLNRCLKRLAVYIDPPVTADVKRLIRLPNSLHGKTGLKVVLVDLDELESFDPKVDALAFGDGSVKVRILRKVKVELGGERYILSRGKHILPEFVAVFLMCRGVALYGH
ncbi:DNA primase catalytic subunit PriS [Archaeoglobus sp.]